MVIESINTKSAPEPVGPYSQAVRFGNLLFCSGQIPIDPNSGALMTGDIKKEATQVLENLKEVIEAAGSSMEATVKVTIYLKNLNDFALVNEVYAQYFTNKPARSCVEVSAIPKGANVEMDAIAVI